MKLDCWITGYSGFIGRYLTKRLKHKFNVTCVGNENVDNKFPKDKDLSFCSFNFSSTASINDIFKTKKCPDIIIHAGWGYMTEPMSVGHLEMNVLEGKLLVDIFFRNGLEKFVFLGTITEYGSLTGCLSEVMMPVGRLTNYSKAKIIVANYGLKVAKEYNKSFIHIRSVFVYGAGQRYGSLINELYNAHIEERKTKIGPCEQYRDYVYVEDLVLGIHKLLNLEGSLTVNIGNGYFIKVKDFVELFWKNLGGINKNLNFGYLDQKQDEPEQLKSYANLSKLFDLTNWVPTSSLALGIKKTIKHLEENSNGRIQN